MKTLCRLAANPAGNDMWIEIDFDDWDFEYAILNYIQRLLGRHYTPFANAVIQVYD